MSATRRRTHRKAFRPSCEFLEGRQLLNGTRQSLHIGTVYDSLTYGTTLGYATNPTTVEDANGNAVSGNFDYTDGTTDVTDTVLNVGHYDLSVTFNPTDTRPTTTVSPRRHPSTSRRPSFRLRPPTRPECTARTIPT